MKHSATYKQTAPGIPLPNYTASLTIPSFSDDDDDDNDIPEPTLPTPIRHNYLKPNAREYRSHPYFTSRKGDLLTTVLRETYKLSVSLKDLHQKIDTLLSEYQKVTGSTLDPKFPPLKDCDCGQSDNGSNSGYNSSTTENCDDSKRTTLKETSIGFLIN